MQSVLSVHLYCRDRDPEIFCSVQRELVHGHPVRSFPWPSERNAGFLPSHGQPRQQYLYVGGEQNLGPWGVSGNIYLCIYFTQIHTHTRDLADQSQTSSFSNITTYRFDFSAVKYRGFFKYTHYYIMYLTLLMLSVGFFSFQNITLTVLTVILSCDALGKPREV